MSKKKKKGRSRKPMGWMNVVALILMACAIFAYLATLDESDPAALPGAETEFGAGVPDGVGG